MTKLLSILLISVLTIGKIKSQTTINEILEQREAYKMAFLEESQGPLRKKDLKHLQFFDPNLVWVKAATLVISQGNEVFEMPTSSGKIKTYEEYGIAEFEHEGNTYQLRVYQSTTLREQPEYADYLFIPFYDATSGESSYGGGRYLDLSISDIQNNQLTIDFNGSYNPYCAYSGGYSCPVPPEINRLPISVFAGEKNFTGKYKD